MGQITRSTFSKVHSDEVWSWKIYGTKLGKAWKLGDAFPGGSAEIEATTTTADENLPSVFLAEATPDLSAATSQLKTFIEKLGYRVVPESIYSRSACEFVAAAESDLKEGCKLFVQWLGPFASYRTTDLPNGYEGLQLEAARKARLATLRAYQRDALELNDVSEPSHRDFLDAEDVMALDLEEFKKRIDNTLTEIRHREELAQSGLGSDVRVAGEASKSSVLITVCAEERPVALKIKERLGSLHPFGFEIVIDEPETFRKLTEYYHFDGLIVVFGENATDQWVADWMRSCAYYRIEAKPREPACAVFLDPGENRSRLLSEPHFFNKIDEDAEAEIAKFIAEINESS